MTIIEYVAYLAVLPSLAFGVVAYLRWHDKRQARLER